MTTLRVFTGTLFILSSALAQAHLRGTLTTNGRANEYLIEMRPTGSAGIGTATAMPGLNGQFDFPNLKVGHYLLSVKTHSGDSVKEEQVFVANGNAELTVRLKDARPQEGTGTVSLARLTHKTPKAARKAMDRYHRCRQKADETCAAKALDDALAADPAHLEAYVNRSALYARQSQWALASADIDAALRLDPQCSLAHANRAFVAIHQQDYRLARVSALAALGTEPGNPNVRYLLALARLHLGEVDRGFRELETLAADYEPARRTLIQAAPLRDRLNARRPPAVAFAPTP